MWWWGSVNTVPKKAWDIFLKGNLMIGPNIRKCCSLFFFDPVVILLLHPFGPLTVILLFVPYICEGFKAIGNKACSISSLVQFFSGDSLSLSKWFSKHFFFICLQCIGQALWAFYRLFFSMFDFRVVLKLSGINSTLTVLELCGTK